MPSARRVLESGATVIVPDVVARLDVGDRTRFCHDGTQRRVGGRALPVVALLANAALSIALL